MTPSPYRTVIEAMFRIVDRVGVAGDFRLNPQQAELDAGWSRRNLVTKIRQHSGISSYVIARYTAKCLAEQNRRCVIVSAEADATARLLARARYILNNLKLPEGIKPQIGTDSQRAITFTKTGSSFWIGTAGSRVFGRGDTITDLHLSEAAFYDSAETLTGGLLPAAEMGEVTVESTGNGVGNWFHRQAVQAREGLGFKLFFFGWVGVQSCRVEFGSEEERAKFITSFRDELEEPDLAARGIEPEQLAWRRERLIEYEYDLRRFKENYPVDFDECFQSTGYGFFRRLRWSPTAEWVRESTNLHLLSTHPQPGLHYAIGGDPAGGVGRDNSVAEVFCLETAEQVAEFASSRVEPDEFGRIVAALGQRFNFAYINIERNNHGLTTIASLTQCYPVWLLHRNTHGEQAAQDVLSPLSHYGTLTGPANRGIIIGTLRRLLADTFTIHSPLLRSELGTFIEKADGKVEADSGCFDDRVMAAAMAMLAVERAGLMAGEGPTPPVAQVLEADPFSWAAIFGEDDKREKFGTSEVYH